MRFAVLIPLFLAALAGSPAGAAGMPGLFAERARTLVFIEYYVEREIDRQGGEGIGLVMTADGLVVCLPHVFPDWVPPDRFKDIRLYASGNPVAEGFAADYLGQDWVNGWHYLRIRDMQAAGKWLRPITDFPSGRPDIGDLVWGVCMTPGDLDYITYYRDGRLSVIQPLPLDTAFSTSEVAVPGGPVFLEDGRFAGWAGRSLPTERDMWVGQDYFRANIRNPDESLMFLLAEPFYDEVLKRVPANPLENKRPWIGLSGTQPLDKDTARFMGLTGRGAIIVSEVLEDTPASRAGLQDRDIVVSVNGKPLPRLKPDAILQLYFEREILLAGVGNPVVLGLMRGEEQLEVEVRPQHSPTSMKEARRQYFDTPGVTLREYILPDALQRREDHRQLRGLVVNFVKPNSPAAAGELQPGDWILEIAGQQVAGYEEGVRLFEQALADQAAAEIVLLVRRGNETAVLRVRKP